jgi:hypothetical protein
MAAITSAVVVAGAGAYSAKKQSDAAKKAAKTQAQSAERGQDFVQQNVDRALPLLQEGFGGAQGSITGGTEQARRALLGGLDPTLAELTTGFEQAQQTLSPTAQQGAGASQLQAALSGALGPAAQQQAIQDFQSSPGQDFLQGRQEQALLRNEAALGGGLGQSGRVLSALQEQAAGFAAQDFQNQFARLGQIAGRGDVATTNIANLQAQLGQQRSGLRGGLSQALAGLSLDEAQQLAQLQRDLGTNQANTLIQQGTTLAGLEQNRGAALAGYDAFRAQQTPPVVQGLQAGLAAYGGLGGQLNFSGFGQSNPGATQAGYSGPAFQNWVAAQGG